jgi:DNA modification methylase
VNVERIRVKDAFTRIWWMSPVERPKADNRRVLRPYSRSMEQLLKTGKYNAGKRPSEHGIGQTSFVTDNGGAIPANVFQGDDAPGLSNFLKCANTKSSNQYHLFCNDNKIDKHPARMPTEIAEFFIKYLTDEGETVLDPFAGSNTTGATAERLNRKWISIEEDWSYVRGSFGHFSVDRFRKVGSEVLFVDAPESTKSLRR